MTETAGTLCAAANILKERGAQRKMPVFLMACLGMARERISGSRTERVLTSDTVPMAYGPKVDCVSGETRWAMPCSAYMTEIRIIII
ncbi:MAG: hypothetical protein ACLT38_09950 [Akkermansia sp.]